MVYKIDRMSSKEIAEITGKRHCDVLRDIRVMLKSISKEEDHADLRYEEIQGVTVKRDERNYISEIELDEVYTLTLVTGYNAELRNKVIKRWKFLEEQLRIVQFREGDKKHQLAAMEALAGLLPEDAVGDAVNYIKANTVVNKAVSNFYGFPKMLKKDQMNDAMLTTREKILDDYLKLYDVFEDNSQVASLLYAKYDQKKLEAMDEAS